MTSEALGGHGQLQSCYTARARPKCLTKEKCNRCLNNSWELKRYTLFRIHYYFPTQLPGH